MRRRSAQYETKAYPGTQAVVRALRLLKAFTAERSERSLTELAREVGLNKTTTYRLLTALMSEGMVARSSAGDAFRLGPEVLALGSRSQGAGDLRAAARPELLALAAETRETATLEVLVGRDVLILDEVMGSHVLGTVPSIGTRWPAHVTSTGKALLAHLPEPVLDAVLGEPFPAPTAKAITDPAALRRELARVRERGYAVSAEELEPGFVAVGVPVRSADGSVVAAISLGGPKGRLTSEEMAAYARRLPVAAGRIAARLGFREGGEPRASLHVPTNRGGR
jgi:IclR family acetate operon transcriptional repressor